jgi:alpha-beta hydrolase superfamily lysophospholipase
MSHLEMVVGARDGLPLHLYCWPPAGAPRGVLLATHGHGEYTLKYTHVAEALNAGGYAYCGYDTRGHGRSGGPRGHVPRYEAFLSDLHQVREAVEEMFPALPLFLLGHSLGGQITLAYLIERQPSIAGAVVSAPWLRPIFTPPAWKMMLARVLSGAAPAFQQDTGLDAAVPMTHDEVLKNAYPEPHLSHSLMSARLGMEALARGEAVFQRAAEVRAPLLLLHGEADGVFAASDSQAFFERVGAPDKTFRIYPGLYHEILNETERRTVFADILSWLDARV